MQYYEAIVESQTEVYADSPEDARKQLEESGYVVYEIWDESGELVC